MRKILKDHFGFQGSGLRDTVGGRGDQGRIAGCLTTATSRESSAALSKKVEGKMDARVVVFMAGHGSRQPDLLRNPEDVKADGMSEVFLPADLGRLG